MASGRNSSAPRTMMIASATICSRSRERRNRIFERAELFPLLRQDGARASQANREGEIVMNVQRHLLLMVALVVAVVPASGQERLPEAMPANIGVQSSSSMPDF